MCGIDVISPRLYGPTMNTLPEGSMSFLDVRRSPRHLLRRLAAGQTTHLFRYTEPVATAVPFAMWRMITAILASNADAETKIERLQRAITPPAAG